MERKNSVAIITGASGGIGNEIAKKLASLGYDLALCGRNKDKLLSLKDMCEDFDVNADVFCGDFIDEEYLTSVLEKINKHFGKIDILINCAGMTLNSKMEDTSMYDYDKIMNLNARVPYYLCKDCLKYLRVSKEPTIINIASVVGNTGYVNQSAYSASKHALVGFTESLAKEVYKEGIRVHLISPGGVFTDMVKISRPDLTGENMIMPSDVADIVEFILTHRTNAVIDTFNIHRANKEPF